MYYFTQMIGDETNLPVLKASASFTGMAIIDSDPYGPDGQNWYTNQNNFYRQVRNFVIDLTGLDQSKGAGIHWQVAQATSLQNIVFKMVKSQSPSNKQQGVFMDNGSGGFMSDLVFHGGNQGMFLGNQQFTTRNLTFNGCNTAIYMNWNWLWALKSVFVNDCGVGVNMSSSPLNQTVGSVLLSDSVFRNTPHGVITAFGPTSVPNAGGTLIVENVDFSGSEIAISGSGNSKLLSGGSTVKNYVQGNVYTRDSGNSNSVVSARERRHAYSPNHIHYLMAKDIQSSVAPSSATPSAVSHSPAGSPIGTVSKKRMSEVTGSSSIPSVLKDSKGRVVERSRPQYANLSTSCFVSVKSKGAKGDGQTDDTQTLRNIFDSAQSGQVIYFDHGAYLVTDTVKIPKDVKITGEIWPMIMASGKAFADSSKPKAVFQVGQPGDKGTVEISDLVFQTKGPAPGAVLVEWNVAGTKPAAAGMWDVHARIGGSAGTEIHSDNCPTSPNSTTTPRAECEGAFLVLHVTKTGSGYFENNWFWIADHDLDLAEHKQLNVFSGRGVLVENEDGGPVWMYGSSSEHSVLYNYQLSNARNVYMSVIQTETPYFQGNPTAPAPFHPLSALADPAFSRCTKFNSGGTCKKSWGLRVLNSSDVFVYGAGLYSWYDNYEQTCLGSEDCQTDIFQIDGASASAVQVYGLNTKASSNMVTATGGKGLVNQGDNRSSYCSTLALFMLDG